MKLKREKHKIPDFVKDALQQQKLMDDYNARPAYQRNDYIGWIQQAKQEDTKQKRLKQMLRELKKGGVYMNMKHNPSRKRKS